MCYNGPKNAAKMQQSNGSNHTNLETKNILSFRTFPIWIAMTVFVKEFAILLPHWTTKAAQDTFIMANYSYDTHNTLFDNTILTYGTDYAIAIIMTTMAIVCLLTTNSSTNCIDGWKNSRRLRVRSAMLLMCYAVSVLAGAIAHQFYEGVPEILNTSSFRILWTVCVGFVTFAAGIMGSCGSEICRKLHSDEKTVKYAMPIVPDYMWAFYGIFMTATCAMGHISCKRPACDIFLAGVTQFIPTFYSEVVILFTLWNDPLPVENKLGKPDTIRDFILRKHRIIFYVGFILNAPLFLIYPLAVQYTSLSLGVVNALLHLNLTMAWGMQALSLRQICSAFNNRSRKLE